MRKEGWLRRKKVVAVISGKQFGPKLRRALRGEAEGSAVRRLRVFYIYEGGLR